MLRAFAALGLLPLLVAASDDACRLCAAEDAPHAAAEVRQIPISIDITTQLDFSRAALSGAGGGAIEMNPDSGGRRIDGGLIDMGGPAIAGSAVVRGEPGRSVRIDMPQIVKMTSSTGGVIEISGLRTNLASMPQLDATGRLSFSFGGRLLVRGSVAGTFRGRIPITAQYE
jgi:hypothetical protein